MSSKIKFTKSLVEQHNLIRKNPKSYIPLLEEYLEHFKGNFFRRPLDSMIIETNEGETAVRECIDFLKNQPSLAALIYDEKLSKAAEDHAEDIGSNGLCDHTGSDGSTPDERISRYLDWDITVSENLDFGNSNVQDVIISLIVDDGVKNRGHRKNIFNPQLNFIGVGYASHRDFAVCTVLNYCGDIVSNLDTEYSQEITSPQLLRKNPSAEKIFLSFINKFYKGAKEKMARTIKDKSNDTKNEINQKKTLNEDNNRETPVDNSYNNVDLATDPYAPLDAVSVIEEQVVTGIANYTKIIKTYTLKDGSQESVEIETF